MSSPRERAERGKAWLEAQNEAIVRPATSNPVLSSEQTASTRERADAATCRNTPENDEPALRDHSVAAGTASISYVGNVRERLESTAAKRRDDPPKAVTPQDENAQRWADYNEEWKRRTGSYPSN